MAVSAVNGMATGSDAQVAATAMADAANVPAGEQSWRSFLCEFGAVYDADGVVGYAETSADAQSAALHGNTLCDLGHYGVIEVAGEDRQKFLQGLLTSDVKLLAPGQSQFSAWCDAKGRVLATFWLVSRGESLLMLLPRRLVSVVLAKLKMFVLRAKVVLTDRSMYLVRIGVAGVQAGACLSEALQQAVPEGRGATLETADCTVVRIFGDSVPRWLVISNAGRMAQIWSALVPDLVAVGRDAWNLLNINDRVPDILPATFGQFIPQMVGMEALGGLSFSKGCYPGQEVIARLQYRGKLTREAVLAYADPNVVAEAGMPVHGRVGDERAVVGMVVTVAPDADGKQAVLCVVQIEALPNALHLGDVAGPVLHLA